MTGAEDTSVAAPWATAGGPAPVPAAAARRGLFRKYALLFVGLIGAALLVNSGFDFWFSYQENKAALVRVQQEKADAAAQRVEEFVDEIKSQIGWTTHAQWAAGPLDQRRQDYFRLLRQVPAITELAQLDSEGHEQLKVSRLAMDVVGGGADFSQNPAFTEAKAHRTWFSPVYFRKQSEPYMTLAMARDGKNAGVTIAEINLKLIYDVITALKIGQGGYTYVVDAHGRLLAHPDISLVLRDTDLARLPQVAAALSPIPGASAVTVASNMSGRSVLTAHAAIPQLGWLVFVEVPLQEAFAPLYGAAWRTALLLLFGLVAAGLAALVLARRMTGPIRELQSGAARIGAGELSRRIEIHTGDELESLADQFNSMAADLQKSYAELEQRVADRTAALSEALERQTATAEVLGIISSSPGRLEPVFDAMLANAVRICGGTFGLLALSDGDGFRAAAAYGVGADVFPLTRLHNPPPGTGLAALQQTRQTTQVADCAAEPAYGPVRALSPAFVGMRTALHVPMLKEGELLGAIIVYRDRVSPFQDKEIELVESFGKQAVIAIENVRLINETREALEQQTATAEVLGVINASPGDLAPVFDAMLEKAMRLCDAAFGSFVSFDGQSFHAIAHRGVPARLIDSLRGPQGATPGAAFARLVGGETIVHIADIKDDDAYRSGYRGRVAMVDIGGARTAVWVALRKENQLLGAFVIYRQEVRPFTDKQIALLQNFAAQAVIAMENARLITETREALEQQTATAEVLGVINSSPGDLAPVFDAILDKALNLCAATYRSLQLYDGERFRAVAVHGLPEALANRLKDGYRPGRNNPIGRLLAGEPFVHIPDMAEIDDETARQVVELGGVRTLLTVALRKDGLLLGQIVSARREVRPFTEKEIALLQNFAAQAVIAIENARLITETREALEQQTATAEVLGVINSSPGDLAPVFDAMLGKAMHLCEAAFGLLASFDGEAFHAAALRGVPAGFAESWREPRRPGPGLALYRLMQGENLVHVPDVTAEDAYRSGNPIRRALADLGGARTGLWVALRKDAALLGAFVIYRQEVRPFTDKQIALLQNFAAQAVIATENARLITETREALEQQTATAEVLGVINSSPGDLAPVFDAMLEKAHSLCGIAHGSLQLYEDGQLRAVAMRGVPEPLAARLRQPHPPGAGVARLLAGSRFHQVTDQAEAVSPEASTNPQSADWAAHGIRTRLFVPLRREKAFLGMIVAGREEIRPFTEKEIALLQNFAAQAVIAMENARLITETREALEQQTATAEVLGVINASPGDLAPVFDAMLEKALRLCEASFGSFAIFDGELLHAVAHRNVPNELVEAMRQPIPGTPESGARGGHLFRLVNGEKVIPIADFADTDAYRSGLAWAVALVDRGGAHTAVWVALRKDASLLGALVIYRRDVRPFTEKQIALLENFAAQAVIAMENARLITETREALEQQTATAEVLGVINSSPGDLAPVFDAMLDRAMRLCEAQFGFFLRHQEGQYAFAAGRGLKPSFAEYLTRMDQPGPNEANARVVEGAPYVHINDMKDDAPYRADAPFRRAIVDLGSGRTGLGVPMRKDDELLGTFNLARYDVRPFTNKQIALVQNFAAQAVIAMENARLITETREALEQQTATAEVLGVINSSPGDLAPVFEAMLEKAMRLCEAAFGILLVRENDRFQTAAQYGVPAQLAEFLSRTPREPGRHTAVGRMLDGEDFVQFEDFIKEPAYEAGDPRQHAFVELGGARTYVAVALRKDGELVGTIAAYRREVRPFSGKQIGLLQNFAAQAVIAMENARLITETREALEQQTATAEVLRVINSSPGDLAPVFEAMLDKALYLCEASFGSFASFDGELFQGVAHRNLPAGLVEVLREPLRHRPETGAAGAHLARIVSGEAVVAISDFSDTEAYRSGLPLAVALVDKGGARAAVWVALRKEETLVGVLVIYRQEVRPFTDKQIALLQNFAAQAVIAIENARLITETRERTRDLQESLEYQTATSDVLKVISRSTFDLKPVLETLIETAARLCGAQVGMIADRDGQVLATFAFVPEFDAIVRDINFEPGRGSVTGRALLDRRVVHIADIAADPEYAFPEVITVGRMRTALAVPLLRHGEPIGAIYLARQHVEPFSERQIELVQTFADQAVIAIENARLLGELRERTDELGRSVEELKALGEVGQAVSSTLDLGAVLSTILSRSVALAGADAGAIFRYSGGERAFRLAEAVGWDDVLVGKVRELRIAEHETGMGEATRRRTPLQLTDLAARPSYPLRDATLAAGFRSVLIVPLVGAERVFGAIVLERRAAGEFAEATVRLMQTLASQSVLAIQNARLFREIADKSEELRLASQHKSQFLANMSHELRTPMNAILGYTELMVDGIYGDLPEKAAGVLERVQNNGKHLLALINDVLDLSKIEAGQLVFTLDEYALPDVVQSVVSATEALASTKGLKMSADVMPGLPTGRGDARRLQQVLLNLVGNAVKFTDDGEVAIGARAENGNFVLTVRDTGPGIAPEDQDKIFGEFQQVDNSNTRKKGGTGLGLAISKRMVEMQGGTISVDSELGRGATFRVSLPIRVEEIVEELMGAA